LLARGNQVPEEDSQIVERARELQIPMPTGGDGAASLLGVEIDGGLVPHAFSNVAHVAEGDRIAVFGRWIVDCGHAVEVPAPDPGDLTYRSEIHPPLLMAAARVTPGDITTVLFTSRPYLVSQHFTTNPDHAYDDNDPADDGPFVDHMVNEIVKVNDTLFGIPLSSTMVEAHPKIKSTSYRGVFVARLVVRPPTPAPSHGGIVGAADALTPHLEFSYQFTVRSGCTVEVVQTAADTVEILIVFGHAGSPLLPPRRDRTWSKDDLAALDSSATTAFLGFELLSGLIQGIDPLHGGAIGAAVVEAILSRGIKTTEYDTSSVRNVNILDASHVGTAASDGIVIDDHQPFPFSGWFKIAWEKPQNKFPTPAAP
jgi:hypothetical protein